MGCGIPWGNLLITGIGLFAMDETLFQIVFVVTFLVVAIIAVRRSAAVKTATDFAVAGRSLPAAGVAWIIIGTLVGGVATIGTVQMAYTHGVSAGIFTFGSGISCFLLGCFFARALRQEGVVTVAEYLGRTFGERFRKYSSGITALGMFIHVVGQFLAAIAILRAVFGFGPVAAVTLTAVLLAVFVVSGGIAGAGLIGKIKCFMLYLVMVSGAGLALSKGGGMAGIIDGLPTDVDLLSLSVYGYKAAAMDMGSMLIGVLSTQIYLQAIFSAKDVRAARNGAFLSAVLIPPIGAFGIVIGLYLRATYPDLGGQAAQALPFFLQVSFPPVIAAFFCAALLLVVLGTGAGLVLGVTTNICNDFLQDSMRRLVQPVRLLRGCALLVLVLSALLVFTGLDSTILKWSYLSMGLRGSAVFAGLLIIVFFQRLVGCRPVLWALYLLPLGYLAMQLG